jgi:hypothetical protein
LAVVSGGSDAALPQIGQRNVAPVVGGSPYHE